MLAMDPNNLDARKNLVSSLALSGNLSEAQEIMDDVLARESAPYPPTLAAHLARVGMTERAWEVLRPAVALKEAGGNVPASGIAVAYAALGEVDDALNWLERAFEQEGGIYYLRTPDWAPLAAEPRFQALWDRVGLHGHHWALDGAAVP